MNILVTGGAGYIGSHCLVELLQAGHEVIVLDNLCNSSPEALRRAEKIAGRPPAFIVGDIRNRALLDRIFVEYDIDAVMHFAGLKSVGESSEYPLEYYDNNVNGTITLSQAMAAAGIFRFVFSSSATVYGEALEMPITENCPTGTTTNPYGRSKLMVEQMLQDLAASDSRWSIALLRYFNPVGAHESGLIGEDPSGVPNNLLPYISQVAVGRLKQLSVYGNDYPTHDGTGVRDYIHVVDLAKGHLAALNYLIKNAGSHIWNLGTGAGYSVLGIIKAFEYASGRKIYYKIVPRRMGDIPECWADPSRALVELGWKAEKNLQVMMQDTWRWQINNPNGYNKGTDV